MGDESRFSSEYVRDQIWTARDENARDIKTRIVVSRKIDWFFYEFHMFHDVIMPPPKASFNAPWFVDGNLVTLIEKFFSPG
jgi:hypothetical protein